ncbi:uncharacterized protein N7484_000784 [Penicillium longicatenatum]|uniref:uncharacterized protein n=1 Tax=Penicillium longicatenatum TaxID=1561947 RepID=UPI0025483B19|nr:uncharacterized protein N7484_000784 [Penicillium longicatenatum]KAJ5657135.1 hypothetical protein N7484_000784 [Penicillium longicatenatum]
MAVLAFPWTSLADLWGQAGEVTNGVPAHPFDQLGRWPGSDLRRRPGSGGQESCYSNRFQWLPCEVRFVPPRTPNDTLDVQITSYVNNLHPDNHHGLYRHLERLIAASVPSWNEILFYGNTRGRNRPRILTYGCQVHNYMEQHKVFGDVPPFLDWRGLAVTHEEWQKLREAAREYITGPEPPKWKQANPLPRLATNLLDELTPEQWDVPKNVNRLLRLKRRRLAWFEHPEPGVSFSYEQWKQGQFRGRAISPQRVGMFPDPLHHEHTPVQLEQTFKKDGL